MGNSVPSGEAGYRVLRIHPGSPAEAADLELFFDFVVQIENEVLCSPEVSVQSVLKRIDAADGRPIHLTVYNARHRMNREVCIQPARAAASAVLLGLGLHFCSFEEALNSPLRVLGLYENSPASKAGLCAESDYILGDERGAYRGVSDLILGAEEHLGSFLTLYVFNKETETIRKIQLEPRDDWGGSGCIGCDVGSGFLHRVPFSRAAKDVAAAAAAAAATTTGTSSTAAATPARGAESRSDSLPPHEPQQQQQQQQQQQMRQLLSADFDGVPWAQDPAAATAAATAAAAAGLGMAPLDASDPAAADVLASCLLLPTTNSPLRDPAFPAGPTGEPQCAYSSGGAFLVEGFGATGGGPGGGVVQQQQQEKQQQEELQQQQQHEDSATDLLQQRGAAFSNNAKSAYLAYDLPYAAAMISHSGAVIEGCARPGQIRMQTF